MQGSNILVVCYLISGRNWIYIDLSAINNSPICTALIYLNQIKRNLNRIKVMGLFQGCHLLISLIFLSDPKVGDKRQPERRNIRSAHLRTFMLTFLYHLGCYDSITPTLDLVVLNRGQCCPPGDIWWYVETFLVVTVSVCVGLLVGKEQGCC